MQVLVAEAGKGFTVQDIRERDAGLVAQLLPTWEEIWRPEESLKLRQTGQKSVAR